jgi:hypothetical protein
MSMPPLEATLLQGVESEVKIEVFVYYPAD